MTPATETVRARHNATFKEEWHFADDDGNPYDFTNYSAAAFQVRLYGGSPSGLLGIALVTTDAQGVWFREPGEGIIQVRIDQGTLATMYTANLGNNEAGSELTFEYDLRLTAPDGTLEVWMEGDFVLEPGVSV